MSTTPTRSRRRGIVAAAVAVTAVTAGLVAWTVRSGGVELPPPPPTPTGPEVVTVVAAGDIACDPASSSFNGGLGTGTECEMRATSDLALGLDPDAVLVLGDLQYECGGYEAFLASYDPSWGRLKDVTHPVPGNHEYEEAAASGAGDGTDCSAAPDASGYFRYFGDAAGEPGEGWYSFDIGAWHVIALNSNCPVIDGCGGNSPQGRWLATDLAAHDRACTLAYWHVPRFSSGRHGSSGSVSVMWQTLDEAGVDVVLAGHDHGYERFAPLDDAQQVDPDGMRSFVVGTGGRRPRDFPTEEAGSEIRIGDTFGVLQLSLGARTYGWRFLPTTGEAPLDEGTATCT
jgi:hypothetical protein